MKISFGSWAVTRGPFAANPVSLHRLLHKLEDEGYDGVELGAAPPHPHPGSHDSAERRAHVRKEVADHGLAFSAMAADLRGHELVSSDECGLYLSAFESAARFAADLGIPAIRIDTVEPLNKIQALGLVTEEIVERVMSAFCQGARIAAEHHLRVCWEFEPQLPLNTVAEVIHLVDAIRGQGHGNFGVLFDTSHAHVCSGGDELDALRLLGARINHIHLADSDGTVDESGVSRHLPLGAGKIEFDQLLPEIQRVAPQCEWWTVDLYNCADAWDGIAGAKRYLNSKGIKTTH
jgi:sugar phosphate isomerase/epimerase